MLLYNHIHIQKRISLIFNMHSFGIQQIIEKL